MYKESIKKPYLYPFDILFSETSSALELQRIIEGDNSDPRIKILACNRQLANGHIPSEKELLGVIVEVGLEQELDVLASF